MMQWRKNVVVSSVLLLAIALAACTEQEPAAENAAGAAGSGEEVTGDFDALLVYPETGPLAAVAGETIDTARQAYVEMWNEQHPDRQVNLQTCNTEGNPERGLSCVQRYGSDVDVILGPHFGSVFKAAQPMLDQNSLAVTGTPHADPSADGGIFQAIPTADMALEVAVTYMADQGWDSFGLLTSTDTTGVSAKEAALSVAGEHGVEVVSEEFDPEASDMTGQVSAIASQDVDGLFIWSSGAQVVTALRGADGAGFDKPVFLNYSSMSQALMDLAADVIPEELLFTGSAAFVPDTIEDADRRERVEDFAGRYEEIAGQTPDWVAFAMADTAWVGFSAALHAEDPSGMAAWLEAGNEIPAFHASYAYGAEDHVGLEGSQPLQILRWAGDGWEPAG